MSTLPERALSVRQPWAWSIIYGGKDIENRGPIAIRHMTLKIYERIAIHAASGMTRREYESAAEYMAKIGVVCPPAIELKRGGVIGSAVVKGVVSKSMSRWFMGPKGIILKDPEPCDFLPARGQLGLFNWATDYSLLERKPAVWMLKAAAPVVQPEGLL